MRLKHQLKMIDQQIHFIQKWGPPFENLDFPLYDIPFQWLYKISIQLEFIHKWIGQI